ncbi:diiron oxygenase, partial [Streptomyces rochei]|uniref:diiron oxygenase n=1 Tax=Streptomyces rochei TaxID=1928 RepID=UPI00369F823D
MAINITRPRTKSHTPEEGVARRLLDSSAQLSYDPLTEVDWETPLDEDFHGASPEWSTLYGTPYLPELTEAQR